MKEKNKFHKECRNEDTEDSRRKRVNHMGKIVPEKVVGHHSRYLMLAKLSVDCNDFLVQRILIVLL
jgi:hypothetical protein